MIFAELNSSEKQSLDYSSHRLLTEKVQWATDKKAILQW